MRILISGCSGFLGSCVVQQLVRFQGKENPLSESTHLVALRASARESTLPLGSEEVFLHDCATLPQVEQRLTSNPPTHILHLGALASAASCEQDPTRAHLANVAFTRMMVALAERFGAHILFASTDLVFEGASGCRDGGFDEYAPPSPISVYARTKRIAEQDVVSYPLGAVVRLSLLYGHTLSTSRGVLGWIEDTLRTTAPLELFRDEFRTPLYVEDAARAILGVSERQLTGIWHCGGPERLSRVAFGRLVAEMGGFSSNGIVERDRAEVLSQPARPEDVSLNSARLFNTLAFQPHAVRAGLRQVYCAREDDPG